jgi:hypothetical protein
VKKDWVARLIKAFKPSAAGDMGAANPGSGRQILRGGFDSASAILAIGSQQKLDKIPMKRQIGHGCAYPYVRAEIPAGYDHFVAVFAKNLPQDNQDGS